MISVFKNLYKSTDVPYHVPLKKVVERIRVGKSKKLIERIRNGETDLKLKLPCILFSGTFTERNSNSLIEHSGLMVVDFDKYESDEVMMEHISLLKQNDHFVSLFISPSGNGIKGVVKIPKADKETHPKYFKAFQKKYNYDYFDVSNSNLDRVCFESYDPNIYFNPEATLFNPVLIDEGYSVHDRTPLIPINDEDVIINKIMSFDWVKDFRPGERNDFIFNIAGCFCEYGISKSTAEGYILNNIVIGDFSERETVTAINSAYKIRTFNSKFFEDYKKIDRIKQDLKKGKKEVTKKYKIDEEVFDSIKEINEHEDFWIINKKKIELIPLKYKNFLERNGFKKYFPNDTNKPTWVKINSNKVSETSVEKIKDFVLDYLMDRGEIDVWNYCAKYQNLFSESFLLMLETIDLLMLNDSKDTSYIAYKNGILEINKSHFQLIDYIDVDGYIWESHIIQRDFVRDDNYSNDYQRFINNISNDNPLSIECAIGFLLSTYKNKINNKCVILNDELISQNPEGGTGKGLFVQGLKQIRNVSILDGKSFDDKSSFPYQTVSTETQILVFDDVKKNFNFENKFSLVTEGMTLERKNKDAIRLSVEQSPKMIISTNYAIKGEGNSHDRRRHELEIAQYYGKKNTPFSEFGRNLFDDWTADDFNKFDNYIVRCIQDYLNHGLIEQDAKNIKLRKFISETSMEFYEWINEHGNLSHDVRVYKVKAFEDFINEYKDFQRWLTRRRFNIWIQKYCDLNEYKYISGNDMGGRYFEIITGNKNEDLSDFESDVPF